ncbi:uncharacterized protein [Bemisia tabaci]|uniref:uncharacterized protein n=1 Tax=Bemisia tabaci TaxID=7038 RepID=UPI003B28C316
MSQNSSPRRTRYGGNFHPSVENAVSRGGSGRARGRGSRRPRGRGMRGNLNQNLSDSRVSLHSDHSTNSFRSVPEAPPRPLSPNVFVRRPPHQMSPSPVIEVITATHPVSNRFHTDPPSTNQHLRNCDDLNSGIVVRPADDYLQTQIADQQRMMLQITEQMAQLQTTVTQAFEEIKSEVPLLVQEQLDSKMSEPTNPPKPFSGAALEQSPHRENCTTVAPCHSDSIKFKDLPNFNGTLEGIHPKEFVSELDAYYSSSRKSDQTKLFEVGRLFRGSAREWFKVNQNRNKFTSFEDFKSEFLQFFWGPEIQSSVFDTFVSSNQPAPTYGNLSNYFLSRVRNMQYLDVPAPEPYVS